MRTAIISASLGAALALLTATTAHADGSSEVVYPKHQIMTFEGQIVDGNLARPDGVWVRTRRDGEKSSLIVIRKSFRARVLKSLP